MANFQHNIISPAIPSAIHSAGGSGPGLATFVCNAATDAVEFVFQSWTADAITHFVCNVSAVSSPPVVTLSLHPVDASGNADTGTTHATTTFTPAAGINAVAISYTPSHGQLLAFRLSAAGFGAGNTATFNVRMSGCASEIGMYVITIDAGTPTKSTDLPVFGYRTASRSYGFPIKSIQGSDFTPDTEQGLKFTPPADWGSSYQVAGIKHSGRSSGAGVSFIFRLYTSALAGAAAAESHTRDSDAISNNSGNGRGTTLMLEGLTTINHGDPAYLVIAPITGTYRIYAAVFETAGDAKAYGGGVFTYVSRTDPATDALTETDTIVPFMSVILADWTEATGGGGGASAYTFA